MTTRPFWRVPTRKNDNMIRITKRKLEEYSRVLSERDKAVMQSIKMCRFLKTDQVRRLHFAGVTTQSTALRATSRTLTKLHGSGLIQPLRRRIGGVRAGSTSYIWTLKTAGIELLKLSEETSSSTPQAKPRKRIYEPTYIFLKHTLAVAELYVRLYTANTDGISVNLVQAEFEPSCWRGYNNPYGVNVTLKPDLYAVTATDGYEDYWFFEVDLDTEAPQRIIQKCERYGNYYLTGREQADTGVFPQVVWISPDEKRKQTLKRHIRENLSEYVDLFVVITFEELNALLLSGVTTVAPVINSRNPEYPFKDNDFLSEGVRL